MPSDLARIRHMMPAEQPKIIAPIVSPEPSKHEVKAEKELQNLIANWLRTNDIYFIRQRMDRKSNTHTGAPDFHVCAVGEFVAFEIKLEGKHATLDQERELQRIRDNGGRAFVVRSLPEVIQILKPRN